MIIYIGVKSQTSKDQRETQRHNEVNSVLNTITIKAKLARVSHLHFAVRPFNIRPVYKGNMNIFPFSVGVLSLFTVKYWYLNF